MHFYGTNILDGCATNVAGSSVFIKGAVINVEQREMVHLSSVKSENFINCAPTM